MLSDNLSDSEEEESDFEKMYKMTRYELEQQNIDTLVEHIIDLKQKIANNGCMFNFKCVCGEEETSGFGGDCHNCNRPMCSYKVTEYGSQRTSKLPDVVLNVEIAKPEIA